jgi:hypothetical protein
MSEVVTVNAHSQPAAHNGRASGPPQAMGTVERVIACGDLAKLTSDERVRYYGEVCHSLGLNPLTQPFAYIELNKKLVLYCQKGGTDQLRKINNVELQVVERALADGIITVHVRASIRRDDGTLRTDEDFGCVSATGLGGENLANAWMKAITKAKRRATLSLLGLGFLDESEVQDMPAARVVADPDQPRPVVQSQASQPKQIAHTPASASPVAPAAAPAPNMPNAAPTTPATVTATMTRDQHLTGLKRLYGSLGLTPERWKSLLSPYGVDSATKLSAQHAKELFGNLQHAESLRDIEAAAKGRPTGSPLVIDVPASKPKEVAPSGGAGAFPGEAA